MDESPEEIIIKVAPVAAVLVIAVFVFWLFGTTVKFLTNRLFLYGLIVGLIVGSFVIYSIPHYVIRRWKNRFIPWLRNICSSNLRFSRLLFSIMALHIFSFTFT